MCSDVAMAMDAAFMEVVSDRVTVAVYVQERVRLVCRRQAGRL